MKTDQEQILRGGETVDLPLFCHATTSQIAAWDSIQKDLTDRQREVWLCLQKHGPMTHDEIADKLGIQKNSITGRVTELLELRRVCQHERRMNPMTGRNCTAWRAV